MEREREREREMQKNEMQFQKPVNSTSCQVLTALVWLRWLRAFFLCLTKQNIMRDEDETKEEKKCEKKRVPEVLTL